MILLISGTLLGVPFSPANRIKFTLWRHAVENGAHGSKIMPRAPKMVPSGPNMKPQLSPKSYKYHRNMILTPSGTVAVLGAHATVDTYTHILCFSLSLFLSHSLHSDIRPHEVIGFWDLWGPSGTSGDHLGTIIRRSYRCLVIFAQHIAFSAKTAFFKKVSIGTAHQSKKK